MRVAICGPYPYDEEELVAADGLTHAVVSLAESLALVDGLHVTVLSRSSRLVRSETRAINGVSVIWVADRSAQLDYLLGRALLRRKLARALRGVAPDLIHAHGEAPFIRAALDSGRPCVVTLHGIFADQTRAHGTAVPWRLRLAYELMRRWERGYLPRIKHLIAINATIGEYVATRSPGVRVTRINNGVDPQFWRTERREAARPRVLFVGQLSRRKGVHVLLDALAILRDRGLDVELRIVGGDGQDPDYAMQLRASALARERVAFIGARTHSEIAAELSEAWVLCLPSLYEASPLVVVEAMAAGTPVVTTRVGDAESMLAEGGGLVVPPNRPTELAGALLALLGNDGARRAAGLRAREVARQRCDPDVIARQTVAAYEAALGVACSGWECAGRPGAAPGPETHLSDST